LEIDSLWLVGMCSVVLALVGVAAFLQRVPRVQMHGSVDIAATPPRVWDHLVEPSLRGPRGARLVVMKAAPPLRLALVREHDGGGLRVRERWSLTPTPGGTRVVVDEKVVAPRATRASQLLHETRALDDVLARLKARAEQPA
jgi:uncharacterized protein YndB with AHSA1/START domain